MSIGRAAVQEMLKITEHAKKLETNEIDMTDIRALEKDSEGLLKAIEDRYSSEIKRLKAIDTKLHILNINDPATAIKAAIPTNPGLSTTSKIPLAIIKPAIDDPGTLAHALKLENNQELTAKQQQPPKDALLKTLSPGTTTGEGGETQKLAKQSDEVNTNSDEAKVVNSDSVKAATTEKSKESVKAIQDLIVEKEKRLEEEKRKMRFQMKLTQELEEEDSKKGKVGNEEKT